MSRPLIPGVSAAGHVTGGGFWHPGSADGCAKCEPVTGPRVFTIRASDVARCPKRSLAPSHYELDGTCRCPSAEGSQHG